MNRVKIPTIEEIDQRYIDLLSFIEDKPEEEIFVRTKAAALCLSIHSLAEHLEMQFEDDLEKKMLHQRTVNWLKSLEKSMPFKALSASVEEIRKFVVPSYELFKKTLKNT